MKKTLIISFILLSQILVFAQTGSSSKYPIAISIKGNSWVVDQPENTSKVLNRDLKLWNNKEDVIRTYFYVREACNINLAIEAYVKSGSSVVSVKSEKVSKKIKISNTQAEVIPVGALKIKQAGYYYIDLQGISKTADNYAVVNSILLGGDAKADIIKYVDEDFYFGRRGPSVHLAYNIPKEAKNLEWYYNELEVEKGKDVIGSYFMANGFGEGYFGMQVNSENERRILFSVWSPFNTDDPKSIPDDQKIQMLAKGERTYTGEFGNEGSGGQSFVKYDWKPNVRYKFLLRGRPTEGNTTTYSAYFSDPANGEWMLIATFKRPKTSTYLQRFHSFLENFIPDYGATNRQCGYYNQWVADKNGQWYEVNSATFTYDATAHSERRFDYAGGTDKDGFFLKMGGFFSDNTKFRTKFERPNNKQAPEIDFSKLTTGDGQ